MKKITNEEIEAILKKYQKQGRNSFEILEGNGNNQFLISAPHAVEQTREGKQKYPEPDTAVIAHLLNKHYGYSIITKTKNCNDDANYDEKSDYKEAVKFFCEKNKPLLLIDLHGLSKNKKNIINIGTNYGININNDNEMLSDFFYIFGKYGIHKIMTDYPYHAKKNTVSNYIHSQLDQKAIQLEINYGYTRLKKNKIKVVEAINDFCQCLMNKSKIEKVKLDVNELLKTDNIIFNTNTKDDFTILRGNNNVIISAPHSKAGYFEEKIMPSESITGALSVIFHKYFNFTSIYKSKDNDTDFFNTKNNNYKKALKKLITNKTRLFLELHVINEARLQDVAIFVPKNFCISTLSQIINILNTNKMTNFTINSIFSLDKEIRTIDQLHGNFNKIQICFNQRLLKDTKGIIKILKFTKDLCAFFVN